jgi:hypothetical protein
MADNLPPSGADVTESGSLNLPEPYRPHRPVMGLIRHQTVSKTNTILMTLMIVTVIHNAMK